MRVRAARRRQARSVVRLQPPSYGIAVAVRVLVDDEGVLRVVEVAAADERTGTAVAGSRSSTSLASHRPRCRGRTPPRRSCAATMCSTGVPVKSPFAVRGTTIEHLDGCRPAVVVGGRRVVGADDVESRMRCTCRHQRSIGESLPCRRDGGCARRDRRRVSSSLATGRERRRRGAVVVARIETGVRDERDVAPVGRDRAAERVVVDLASRAHAGRLGPRLALSVTPGLGGMPDTLASGRSRASACVPASVICSCRVAKADPSGMEDDGHRARLADVEDLMRSSSAD